MSLGKRDLDLLRLLDLTPATAPQVLRASAGFTGGPFRDERRVRERLRSLGAAGLTRSFVLAAAGGGLANYYRLAPEGWRIVHGAPAELPHRSLFAELPPSRIAHSLELADVIVHSLAAAHARRVRVTKSHRENELVLRAGDLAASPDCHLQFAAGGRTFNVLFELDRGTEPLEGFAASRVRAKLVAYEAYQDHVWAAWREGGGAGPRPYFRVAFLTTGSERARHILAAARACARNPDRRLCYAATRDEYLAEPDAVRAPLFLDHRGQWRALVDLHPTAPFLRAPVRIPADTPALGPLW